MLTPSNKTNFLALFFSQMFTFAIPATIIFSGSLIGLEMMGNIKYSTIPVACLVIANALFSYPASKIMQNLGRKFGFIFGNIFALVGSIVAIFALFYSSFVLFCVGISFLGINSSFVQQYRFAVSEGIEEKYKHKALSFLLLSNIIGAIITLQMIPYTKTWFEVEFLGSYVFLFCLLLISFISLLFYQSEKEELIKTSITNQSKIISKKFIFSVSISMLAYMVMSFIMTATPIYLKNILGYSIYLSSMVIQAHMVAMFAPSIISGFLVDKIGKINLIKIGILLNILAIIANIIDNSYYNILIGLILLGVGWNFMFVSASAYLVDNFQGSIKFKAQGINEVFTFSSQATASILSGVCLYYFGWSVLNIVFVPLLVGLLIFSFDKDL